MLTAFLTTSGALFVSGYWGHIVFETPTPVFYGEHITDRARLVQVCMLGRKGRMPRVDGEEEAMPTAWLVA